MDSNIKDCKLFERHGWTLECRSPLEIRFEDGSFASGYAARLIYEMLKNQENLLEITI